MAQVFDNINLYEVMQNLSLKSGKSSITLVIIENQGCYFSRY